MSRFNEFGLNRKQRWAVLAPHKLAECWRRTCDLTDQISNAGLRLAVYGRISRITLTGLSSNVGIRLGMPCGLNYVPQGRHDLGHLAAVQWALVSRCVVVDDRLSLTHRPWGEVATNNTAGAAVRAMMASSTREGLLS